MRKVGTDGREVPSARLERVSARPKSPDLRSRQGSLRTQAAQGKAEGGRGAGARPGVPGPAQPRRLRDARREAVLALVPEALREEYKAAAPRLLHCFALGV